MSVVSENMLSSCRQTASTVFQTLSCYGRTTDSFSEGLMEAQSDNGGTGDHTYIPGKITLETVASAPYIFLNLKYTLDLQVHETVSVAQLQHEVLVLALHQKGWGSVRLHPFIIGSCGMMRSENEHILTTLGVKSTDVEVLLKRLAIQSTERTHQILQVRRPVPQWKSPSAGGFQNPCAGPPTTGAAAAAAVTWPNRGSAAAASSTAAKESCAGEPGTDCGCGILRYGPCPSALCN